jgi:hypothetical protein
MVGGTSYFGGRVYLFDNVSNDANNSSSRLYFAASGYDKGVFLQGINVASYGRKRLGVFVNNEESYNATTWIEALSVLPNGNVGIGTPNPISKLSIQGGIDSYSDTNWSGIISFNRKSTTGGLYNTSFHGFQMQNKLGDLSVVVERTNGTYIDPALLIQGSTGNVGINTPNPSAKLHVAGDILATGGITMYSARKLKNIQDERGLSLDELSTIKPTRFTWKDNRDNKVHIGGIADDVQRVLPEVIYKTREDDTLTMDYGNAAFAIAASLIKPVVSHEQRIRLLEEENKRLKEEVEQLKWNIA